MIRTRVGYTGGTKADPTYYSLGDHTETIEIDFDPAVISYGQLLELFVASHNPCAKPWSRQYMSAIFFHDAEQKRAAEQWASRVAAQRGAAVQTLITKAERFYLAEDYHQKYQLRSQKDVVAELLAIYPELRDFVDSTAATRLNGYLAGYGSRADLARELPQFGLSAAAREKVSALPPRRK